MSLTSAATSSPTYFGPAESPLFGVLHVPANWEVRGAALVCGSLGKDYFDSLRALRLLADGLAERGILALRFDYLGCGDSSFGQVRSNSVSEWQASIGYATDYLRGMGIDDISGVGVRAGALILDSVLQHSPDVKRVVYWDPMGTGRRFLREQTSFFKMATGEDRVPEGVVSMIGARLSAKAAKDFGSLRLQPPVETHGVQRLVISRTEGTDPGVTSLSGSPATDLVVIDGLSECAQPTRLLPPIALDAVDCTVEWIDKRVPMQRHTVSPSVTDTARVAVDNGQFVVERVERIGPQSMFAIRSMPIPAGIEASRPTVMFFTNANNSHHGPNREWVDLSRTSALHGGDALRWDRQGAGESGPANRDGSIFVYSNQGIEDAKAAARHAALGASRLQFAGPCSGGWYAACAAREVRADSVVLVNELLWSLRIEKAMGIQIKPGDLDVTDWEQSRRARLRRVAQKYLPAFAWRQLGRMGVAQAPEVLLKPLAQQGTSATIVLCPADTELFLANRGAEALDRLRASAAPPQLIPVDVGDHAAFHQSVFIELRKIVADFLRGSAAPGPRDGRDAATVTDLLGGGASAMSPPTTHRDP
ncbi:hypothetical protein [Mycobacterium sp. ST-F2]|uniref:hypothetical protein n=1 Tax=Mycobacterium sp. ST-F2 TaxID=1490484 RepID=UPI0011534BAF|nr:hypothetical protein [Mycobacterium sp. ST-F2]